MNDIYLFLTVGGKKVDGEPTMSPSKDYEKAIEVSSFSQALAVSGGSSTGPLPTGQRNFNPVSFSKRLDKASPLIMKALTENEPVKAEFRFFRAAHTNDGTFQHYYTVELDGARIASVSLSGGSDGMEQVEIAFTSVVWTYVKGGITHSDSWDRKKK